MHFFDLRWLMSELKIFNSSLDDSTGRIWALTLIDHVIDIVNQRHLSDEQKNCDILFFNFEELSGCCNGEDLIKFNVTQLENKLGSFGYDKRVQVRLVQPENKEEFLVMVVMDLDATIEIVNELPKTGNEFDFFNTVADNPDMAMMEQYEQYYKLNRPKN